MDGVPENSNTIKHLVLSGGGVTGISFYGVLRESEKNGFWNINNIESIYGTSVGSVIAIMIALKYDWEILDDFIIKRPWSQVFQFNMYAIIESFQKRGILDIQCIEKTFLPLFNGKDISKDITMKEFYELTKINIHIYTTELNAFELVDISHETHPDWKVIEAVYCSCSLPVVFSPLIKEGKCYIDGGFMLNYPLIKCIDNGCKKEEIYGLSRRGFGNTPTEGATKLLSMVNESSSLLDYILIIMNKSIEKLLSIRAPVDIPYQLFIDSDHVTIYNIYTMSTSREEREKHIQFGVDSYLKWIASN